jgi:hypothetical protein
MAKFYSEVGDLNTLCASPKRIKLTPPNALFIKNGEEGFNMSVHRELITALKFFKHAQNSADAAFEFTQFNGSID